jgi:hypothetical protein
MIRFYNNNNNNTNNFHYKVMTHKLKKLKLHNKHKKLLKKA